MKTIAKGLKFPEGPAIDYWTGDLYVTDAEVGIVVKILKGKPERVVDTGGTPTGLAIFKNKLYIADSGVNGILQYDFSKEKLEVYVENYKGEPFNGPNDLVFDAEGGLYFTTPLDSEKIPKGKIFYVNPRGKVELFSNKLYFPNGICLSKRGDTLLVAETHKQRIISFSLTGRNKGDSFTVLAELPGKPDGLCIDQRGNIYAALYGSGCIIKLSQEGEVLEKLRVPGTRPTNIAFGGCDLSSLFITEVDGNQVLEESMNVRGYKLFFE